MAAAIGMADPEGRVFADTVPIAAGVTSATGRIFWYRGIPRTTIFKSASPCMAASVVGTRSVCEGVETEQQLDMLRHFGCTEVQGYLLVRHTPNTSLADSIRARSPRVMPSA